MCVTNRKRFLELELEALTGLTDAYARSQDDNPEAQRFVGRQLQNMNALSTEILALDAQADSENKEPVTSELLKQQRDQLADDMRRFCRIWDDFKPVLSDEMLDDVTYDRLSALITTYSFVLEALDACLNPAPHNALPANPSPLEQRRVQLANENLSMIQVMEAYETDGREEKIDLGASQGVYDLLKAKGDEIRAINDKMNSFIYRFWSLCHSMRGFIWIAAVCMLVFSVIFSSLSGSSSGPVWEVVIAIAAIIWAAWSTSDPF